MLPTGLYIHIPWCIKKCPYCDFNSHVHEEGEGLPKEKYLQALLADLDDEIKLFQFPPVIQSVFIGGGTPSLMSASFYRRLFDALRQRTDIDAAAEITLEANPGTVDEVNFEGYVDAGINRLSLGVQSFSNDALKKLGRIHSADDAERAFIKARDAGFDNINIDLMHGLPGQSLQDALRDIQWAIDLGPEHVSWYQLTIEPNTAFYKFPPILPAEELLTEIYLAGLKKLSDKQYRQYEVSAFARPGYQSRHNSNYWLFGDYLGIGAGAHGKITTGAHVVRRWKTRAPRDYLIKKEKLAGQKTVAAGELPVEFMMNALRLNDGFEQALFEQRTRQSISVIQPVLEQLTDAGLLTTLAGKICATAKGRLFLNDVIAAFMMTD